MTRPPAPFCVYRLDSGRWALILRNGHPDGTHRGIRNFPTQAQAIDYAYDLLDLKGWEWLQ